MRRAIVGLLVAVFWCFSGCSTSLTLSTISVADVRHHSTNIEAGGKDLPTPQFILVDADIKQGRIVVRQHPAWKARQSQDALSGEVYERNSNKASASQEFSNEPDRVLQAISAAFKRARLAPEVPQRVPFPQTHQQTPQARLIPSAPGW